VSIHSFPTNYESGPQSNLPSTDPLRKPPELYALIENFCLGTRRLEIFGRPSSLRRGWVTVGDIGDAAFELEKVDGRVWEKESYEEELGRTRDALTGKYVVPTSPGWHFTGFLFASANQWVSLQRSSSSAQSHRIGRTKKWGLSLTRISITSNSNKLI
jgi:MT-A70